MRAVDIAYSLMLSFFYHATLSNEINVLNAVPFFFFFSFTFVFTLRVAVILSFLRYTNAVYYS